MPDTDFPLLFKFLLSCVTMKFSDPHPGLSWSCIPTLDRNLCKGQRRAAVPYIRRHREP